MERSVTPTAVNLNGYQPHGTYRLFLAMMVLWSHSFSVFFGHVEAFASFQLGNVAVAGFFVLSGYLMAEAIASWYHDNLPGFIANRYLRIAPPLLVAALLSIVIHYLAINVIGEPQSLEELPAGRPDTSDILAALTLPAFPFNVVINKLLPITSIPSYDLVRGFWAINTEMIFYWTIFFHGILARVSLRLAGIIFVAFAAAAYLCGIVAYNDLLWFGPKFLALSEKIPFVFHLQWAPHFLFGAALSHARRSRSISPHLLYIGAALAAMVQLYLYSEHRTGSADIQVVILYAVAIVWIPLLAFDKGPIINRLRPHFRKDKRLGAASYPLYINHFALSMLFLTIVGPVSHLHWAVIAAIYIVYNVFVLASAAFVGRAVDLLTDHWRDAIRGRVL